MAKEYERAKASEQWRDVPKEVQASVAAEHGKLVAKRQEM